ncbi:MAG: hypothetical protein IPO21_01670 [Bacteroidales bacterium]|nr:hypothetical protein [Bacteroidales bacterium]
MNTNTKITLEFSPEEYDDLLRLAYLGEWMANANKKGNDPMLLTEVHQLIYAKAYEEGFNDIIEYDKELDEFAANIEFEEEMSELISEYDSVCFIEELASVFVQRDLDKLGDLSPKEHEQKTEELFDKYTHLFFEKGVESITVNNNK